MAERWKLWLLYLVASVVVPTAVAQEPPGGVERTDAPEWVKRLAPDPGSPESRRFAESQKKRLAVERELRQIRAKYFRASRNTELRQAGISLLRSYVDPAVYPTLLNLFDAEDHDVRIAVFDHLADRESDQGDASLAWEAVFGPDDWGRRAAGERLRARAVAAGAVSDRVRAVLAGGLRDPSDDRAAAAARLTSDLDVLSLLPSLINAQANPGGAPGGGSGGGGTFGGDPGGALAIILVATQQAFVSDLTPVVGDNAVGFDPTVSVATEGTYLAVHGAVVVTYRTEVHGALVALADRHWDGRSTAGLGYETKTWMDWYSREFEPYQRRIAASKDSAQPAPPPKP